MAPRMRTALTIIGDVADAPLEPMRTCRFCLSEEGELDSADDFVEPCLCRGTVKSVHLSCLMQHFKARGDLHDFTCPTCKQLYEGKVLRDLAEYSCAQVVKDFGENSLRHSNSLCHLAYAHNKLGNAHESKGILEKCIAIEENILGAGHVRTSTALEEMATAHGKLGNVQRRKELLERSLAIRECHFGVGNVNTAATLNNLATVYGELGNGQLQRELLERSLAIKEEHFGKSHVQNAATLSNLATVHFVLGDSLKARGLLEQALAIKEQRFGVGHFKTAVTINNLALACGEIGEFDEMRILLERSLAIRERHLGTDHVECAVTLANLAMACCLTGATAAAKNFCRRAKLACEGTPNSLRWCTVLLRTGVVHYALGEVSMAADLTTEALRMFIDVLGSTGSENALTSERIRTTRVWSAAGRDDATIWMQQTWVTERFATTHTKQPACSADASGTIVSLD